MSAAALLKQDACAMADAVRGNAVSAVALVQASLDRIEATDRRVNAFTAVLRERALRRAAQVDASLASANGPRTRELPLLGVPFAVKNLFDIAGLATLAGSKIEREHAPPRDDAALVRSENRIRRRWVGIRVESLNALSLGTWSTRWHHRRRHSRTPAGPRCLGPPGGSSARRRASPTLHCPPSRHGAMGRSRWVFTRWPSPVSPSDARARPVTSPPSNGRS